MAAVDPLLSSSASPTPDLDLLSTMASQPEAIARPRSRDDVPQGDPYAAADPATAAAAVRTDLPVPPRMKPRGAVPLGQSQQQPFVYPEGDSLSFPPVPPPEGAAAADYAGGVTRLPPILQVEKQQVTTSATQAASASRRRNEANFVCPVPGCGSTFTRRFNLRGEPAHAPLLSATRRLRAGRLGSVAICLSLRAFFPCGGAF